MSSGVRVLLRRKREEIVSEARRFAERLKKTYRDLVVGVYIVGSVAYNTYGPRSDVDLIVVVRDKKKTPYVELKTLAAEYIEAPVDLIIIGFEELEEHKRNRTRFYKEINRGIRLL